MAPADLLAFLRRRPFEPFRLVSSDGTTYEVRHPDLVLVSLSSAVVGYPSAEVPGAAMRYDLVSLRHVVRLEPVEPAVDQPAGQAPDNGPA